MPTDDQLDPASQEVRRLLASARHTDPIPTEVAARLDDVLAGLVAEGPAGAGADGDRAESADEVAPVVDLASRRRRRIGAGILAAAAACALVAGVGPTLLNTGAGDDASTAGSSSERTEMLDSTAEDSEAAPQPNSVPNDPPTRAPREPAATAPAPSTDSQAERSPDRDGDELGPDGLGAGTTGMLPDQYSTALSAAGLTDAEQEALRDAVRELRAADAVAGRLRVVDRACTATASGASAGVQIGKETFAVTVSAETDGFRTVSFTACTLSSPSSSFDGDDRDEAAAPTHVVRVRAR